MSTSGGTGCGWREERNGTDDGNAQAQVDDRIKSLVDQIQSRVRQNDNDPRPGRTFHKKGDVLRVEFIVDEVVPEWCRVAFLRPGAKYPGFGRFSHASSNNAHDVLPNQSGFAFRIQVDGRSQDFLMTSTPRSFVADPVEFLDAGNRFVRHGTLAGPLTFGLSGFPSRVGPALQLVRESARLRPPFTSQAFWSRTPYALGGHEDMREGSVPAVKYMVRPLKVSATWSFRTSRNYFSDQLRADLRNGPIEMAFCLQPYVDESVTPIEDAAFTWREKDSPFIPVGRVVLLEQDLADGKERQRNDEFERRGAFTPWNHAGLYPLGRMNRGRRIAYDHSADRRGAVPPHNGR